MNRIIKACLTGLKAERRRLQSRSGLFRRAPEKITIGFHHENLPDIHVNRHHKKVAIKHAFQMNTVFSPHLKGNLYNLYLNSIKQKVKRISHEDLSAVNEWENISSFLYDILSGFYD